MGKTLRSDGLHEHNRSESSMLIKFADAMDEPEIGGTGWESV
jgi:hypothetical protein